MSDSIGDINEDVAAIGSYEELVINDAINVNKATLDDSTLVKKTGDTFEAVIEGIADTGFYTASTLSEGIFKAFGMNTKSDDIEEVREKTKQLKVQNDINDYIKKSSNDYESSHKKTMSALTVKLFMQKYCTFFPIPKYSVKKIDKGNNEYDITVNFSYATENTVLLVESLNLLLLKIEYLLKKTDIVEGNKLLLNLNKEKIIQLLYIANLGGLFSSSNYDEYDAGTYVTDVETNYKTYTVEFLKLFQDFFKEKKQSEELINATRSLNEINRNTRQAKRNEWWKSVEEISDNLKRGAENIKEGTTEFIKGTSDIATDSISHIVDSLIAPVLKLFLLGFGGIILIVLYNCLPALIKYSLNKNTIDRSRKLTLKIPREMWKKVSDERSEKYDTEDEK
jgi:translation initiation factor 2B subunit (eIF-2B alpha/beta/delta family)